MLWTTTALSITKLVLERISIDPESIGIVKPRTVPVFTFVAQAFVLHGAAIFFLSWDIDITGWLASAGIVGIAVGFAAKTRWPISSLVSSSLQTDPTKLGTTLS